MKMSNNFKTCSICGKKIRTDAKYCMFCGTECADSERQSATNNKTIIMASIGAAIVFIVILGIIVSGKNGKLNSTHVSGLQENKETSAVKPSEDTVEDIYVEIEKPDEKIMPVFTYTNSQGESLKVESGYSYVSCTTSMQNTIPHNATILIPPIFNYTSDEFVMGAETGQNDIYTLSFKNEKLVNFEFIENYIKDLEKYGFTHERTYCVSDDQKVYYLNYSGGNITHGAAEFIETYDMEITSYKLYGTTGITFKYPKEVWFDLGEIEGSYTAVKVLTDCSLNEIIEFTIRGWSQDNSDYIVLSFDPDTYGTGTVIKASDFRAQSGAGKSALCNAAIWGRTISGSGWPVYADSFDYIDVNVLQCDDSCIAISYSIKVPSGSAQYLLEGICVADVGRTSSVIEGTNGEPEQIYSGAEKCITCNGVGKQKCTSCGGSGLTACHKCTRGRIQCSQCNGTGRVGNSYGVGGTSTCAACRGIGYKDCTCNNGWVQCASCRGEGYKNCIMCNGTGKR